MKMSKKFEQHECLETIECREWRNDVHARFVAVGESGRCGGEKRCDRNRASSLMPSSRP